MAGDLILIVETELRAHGAVSGHTLKRIYREVLEAQEIPGHRVTTGWEDRIAHFDLRLDAHLAQPKRGIEELCEYGAGEMLAFAPVEDAIREADREMVVNNVKFRAIDYVAELRKRTDWPALGAALAA